MSSVPLWIGTLAVAASAGAAVGLPVLGSRRRLALLAFALLLAPVLIGADNWNGEQVRDLRDSPTLIAAAALLGLIAVAGLAALFRSRPLLVPLALVATMAFRIPVDLGESTVNLLIPLYLVIAAGMVAALVDPEGVLPREETEIEPTRFVGPALAIFLGFYAIQSAYADGMSAAVENLCFFFVPFAALYLLIVRAPWDRRLLTIAVGILVVEALVVAAVAFGQYAVREIFWNEKVMLGNEAHPYFRVNSLFFDPNIMGRYLAVTMIAVAGVTAWGRRRESGLATAVFVVLLAALAVTFSQSSMLALIAGVLVLIAGRIGVWAGIASGLATLAVFAVLATAVGGTGLTDEASGREGLVSGGLELAGQAPVFGNGSGSFPAEFEERFGGGEGIATESHNEPVTVLAEQGAVGMIPYLLVLVVTVATLWRGAGVGMDGMSSPIGATLLAAYAAMLVHSLGYAAFFTDPITWAMLALAVALPASAPSSRSATVPAVAPEPA